MSITTYAVTTSVGNAYVSSGNTAVTWMSITNYGGTDTTANVWVVPSGSSAGNTNIVLASLQLTGNGGVDGDTYQIYNAGEKLLLGNGDSIQINANNNANLTVVTSYTTI